ncbi:MAG: single-stranded DNA-binding protein [Lachnospiraceae bacterium]|nr:single-stranded DNA-binding protein [Lachnospiraceae bacterium]
MNKAILMGRLTRDPDIRYVQGEELTTVIARYTLAVDRRGNREGGQTADFISCVAFGKIADFTERYLKQGTKIVIEGRIQTGSYLNREGKRVYTTEVVVENCEFAESKGESTQSGSSTEQTAGPAPDGFMNIPDGIEAESLPFT